MKEKVKDKFKNLGNKIKDGAMNKISNTSANLTRSVKLKIAQAKKIAKFIMKMAVKLIQTTVSIITNIVSFILSPIGIILTILIILTIIILGMISAFGKNSVNSECGTFNIPEINNKPLAEKEKSLTGILINDGFNKEQATYLSSYISQISKADPLYNISNDACDNDCLEKSSFDKAGIFAWSNSELKELAKFAKEKNSDWKDSSTQMAFLSKKLNEKQKDLEKEGFLDENKIGESLEKVFNKKVDLKALNNKKEEISKTYKNEGKQCKPLGLGDKPNAWALKLSNYTGEGYVRGDGESSSTGGTGGSYSFTPTESEFPPPDGKVYKGNTGEPLQCVWYTINRLAQLGVPTSKTANMGNGGEWYKNAPGRGFIVTRDNVKAGMSICWPPWVGGTKQWGHIAFVEKVYENGDIQITEYNWVKETFGTRRISKNTYTSQGLYFIDHGVKAP